MNISLSFLPFQHQSTAATGAETGWAVQELKQYHSLLQA